MGQRLLLILLTLILLIGSLIAYPPVRAQFSNTDFRVSQLETEVGNLRSQVNRLAASLDRLTPTPLPTIPTPPNSTPETAPIAPADTRFNRLATLVIELRQEVIDLHARVRALETQRSPS